MADLLIRDLAMPKDRNTTLIIYCDGTINLRVQMEDGEHLIPITAKAVPLPEGHGRLIDADDMQSIINTMKAEAVMDGLRGVHPDITHYMLMQEMLEDAETIIEAEGGGEQC